MPPSLSWHTVAVPPLAHAVRTQRCPDTQSGSEAQVAMHGALLQAVTSTVVASAMASFISAL